MEPQSSGKSKAVRAAIAVVLLLAVLALAYVAYQRVTDRPDSSTPTVTEEMGEMEESESATEAPPDFPELSPDERAALDPPSGADATEAERREHFLLVERIATWSEELAIGPDCAVSPAVLRTELGADLRFKNYDTEPHFIIFDENVSFSVPAGGQVVVPVRFGTGSGVPGVFGYGCDTDPTTAGMLLVTPG